MILENTGKIAEGLYMVGNPAMPVYLLDGDQPAIFDAGLAFLGDIYIGAIKEILGSRPLAYCFLTHSHYDHCGSVSVIKDHFPSMTVLASAKVKRIMGRPNAIRLIRDLTQAALQVADCRWIDPIKARRFEPFEVDHVLQEGAAVDLSNHLRIKVLETPGHTWDTLSYYLPQKKVLLCSEAAGMPDHSGYIVSDCLVDYGRYLESMIRLSRLDVDVLCLGHSRVYTGGDVKTFFQQSISQCQEFFRFVAASLCEEQGNLEKTMQRVKKLEYDGKKGPKQLEAAYLLNLEARVKAVQKCIQDDR